ncbi:MAG: hypothetical protein R3240_08370 [Gammaproteobacteria bacterium]|nr:hypothetical protein [Gammaproteobacteria bacterium]
MFDIETFENLWRQNRELMVLQEIVKKHYGFSNLDQDEKLKAALIEAFKAGKAAK